MTKTKSSEQLYIINEYNKKLLVADADMPDPGNWLMAQEVISTQYQGWRMPSIDELEIMYEQLHKNGKGNFIDSQYWSGTEESPQHVWYINFKDGHDSDALKIMGANVRLVADLQS